MSKGNGKYSRRVLNELYARPLPLVLSSDIYGVTIPPTFPHNPISLGYLIWKVIQINALKPVPQSKQSLFKVTYDQGVFKVVDDEDATTLWRCGFFGKGILSRSEPTWKERTLKKLNAGTNELAMEDLTLKRREERKQFKNERARVQELELKQRQGIISSDEKLLLEQLSESLASLRLTAGSITNASVKSQIIDETRIDDLIELEYFQLQAIEVFYLQFVLNVLEVTGETILSLKQLFLRCCKMVGPVVPTNNFIIDYVVYDYFRSLGWCARSGIKFGCDMLLYKRGPPFMHAEYAVMVIRNDENPPNWNTMAANARVIGTVKKNLVLMYVDCPEQETLDEILNRSFEDDKERFMELFNHYKVTEILYRRWAPGRTRD